MSAAEIPDNVRAHLELIAERVGSQVRSTRVAGCPHVGRTNELTLCASHPTRYRCVRCMAKHTLGHPPDVEHSCDLCGRLVPELHGAFTRSLVLATIKGKGGRPRRRPVTVTVVSIGYCPSCFWDGSA